MMLSALLLCVFVMLAGCGRPAFDANKLHVDDKTVTLLDRNNQPVLTYRAAPGDPVPLGEIPDLLKQAILDAEDSRFYERSGVDLRGLLSEAKGETGSTITQQLAKNFYLTQAPTFARKIKELYLSAQIERHVSKDDILEMYLNRTYFGNGAVGVKAAAETYFGKGGDLKRLTLAECALLAGLPQAPSAYNPWVEENVPAALQRRLAVLDAMQRDGHITEEQRAQAAEEPLKLTAGKSQTEDSAYLTYVFREAEQKLNRPLEALTRGGVTIATNLDPALQAALEKAYRDAANFPPDAPDGTRVQAASVIVDSKTGGIAAVVGGRGGENRVTEPHPLPASGADCPTGPDVAELSPLAMAEACTAVANEGVRAKPFAIREIRDANGRVIAGIQPEQVQSAFPVAAKAAEPASGNGLWHAGFAGRYVMVTWMGFDNTDLSHDLSGPSGRPERLFERVFQMHGEEK